MAIRPVLLTVDDDPEVLSAVERDLKRRYVREYRILSAPNGEGGLDLLRQLSLRGEPVALLLADQRMPGLSGVEFLEAALPLAPGAKRAILTAYADIDAAIGAINRAGVDYYFQKPWDPPEQLLYPVIDDLLDDWRASWRPGFEGIRVIGPRWSPQVHDIKDLLARNQVPYRALDVESGGEATALLAAAGLDPLQLPVVVFPDGGTLVQPSPRDVAGRAGLKTQAERPFYDLAIVGAGPAGLAAAVYGASEGLKTVVLDAEAKAEATRLVFEAVHEGRATPEILALRYLETLQELGKGSNKVFVPYEASAALGSLGTLKELFARESDGDTATVKTKPSAAALSAQAIARNLGQPQQPVPARRSPPALPQDE